jgi:hypothetical protein
LAFAVYDGCVCPRLEQQPHRCAPGRNPPNNSVARVEVVTMVVQRQPRSGQRRLCWQQWLDSVVLAAVIRDGCVGSSGQRRLCWQQWSAVVLAAVVRMKHCQG